MRLLFFLCIYIGSTYYAPAKPNIFRPLQFLNMSFIPEQHLKYSPLPRMHPPAGTDFVEKELRSSSSRFLQSLNISQKPITLPVLKCETSSCFNEVHISNIWHIYIADDVSHFETSMYVNELHEWNIALKSSTFETFHFETSRFFKDTHWQNIWSALLRFFVFHLETSRYSRLPQP